MTKKMILVTVEEYIYIDCVTVEEFAKDCQTYIDKYGPKARFSLEEDRYSDYQKLVLKVEREETDEEYANRLKLEYQFKSYRDKRDAEEYERLKKKFEGV